jgi:ribosomal protein L40E
MENAMETKHLMLTVIGVLIANGLSAAVQEPASPEKETKICRKSEARTGSRIRTGRRCRTAEEWRKEDEERSRIPPSLTVTEGQPDGLTKQRPQ